MIIVTWFNSLAPEISTISLCVFSVVPSASGYPRSAISCPCLEEHFFFLHGSEESYLEAEHLDPILFNDLILLILALST